MQQLTTAGIAIMETTAGVYSYTAPDKVLASV